MQADSNPQSARARRSTSQPADALRAAPNVEHIDGRRVEWYAFSEGLAAETPLVLLGGAFQNARSFGHEVAEFAATQPVFIVFLPGQGTNAQRSGELGLDELSDLLGRFLERRGIAAVDLAGLSYGAAIAHRFAVRHPDHVARLILGGASPTLPDGLRCKLEAAIWLCDHGTFEDWVWACVTSLLNLPARDRTGVSDELVARFAGSLRRLGPPCQPFWRDNTERLLRAELRGEPRCPTLVFTSELDTFIPPHTVATLARSIPDAAFAMLMGADHLAPLQRPQALVALYAAFLRGEPLEDIRGTTTGDAAFAWCEERRIAPRSKRLDGMSVAWTRGDGQSGRGQVRDLSHGGALLDIDRRAPDGSMFRLTLGDGTASTCAAMRTCEDGVRAYFLHTDAAAPHQIDALASSLR